MENENSPFLDENEKVPASSQEEKEGIIEIFDSKPEDAPKTNQNSPIGEDGYSQNYYSSQNQNNSSDEKVVFNEPVAKKPGFFVANKKFIFVTLIIFILVSAIFAGGYFGADYYEKRIQKISLERLLPSGSEGVFELNIQPDSEQFVFLEKNMQKFPGYNLLKKKLDDKGEGKTISEIFFEKIKEKHLDFESDIKPAISENAYILIPDLGPLFKNLENEVAFWRESAGETLDYKKRILAEIENSSDSRVMGESDYRFSQESSEKKKKKPSLSMDFIMGSEIKDMKKAEEIISKLKENSQYETTLLKFEGYDYAKVKIKDVENDEGGSYLNYQETYHAILGGNWIVSSKEDYIKEAIGRKKKLGFWNSFFKKEETGNLSQDGEFKKFFSHFKNQEKKGILGAYVRLNLQKIFGEKDCSSGEMGFCLDRKYFKYPPELSYGFSILTTEEGFRFTSLSNEKSFKEGEFKNKSKEFSLAGKMPSKEGDLWLDMFLEHSSPKDFYYGIKKNNLTDEGIKKLNEARDSGRSAIGIDFESDFIDVIAGALGFAVFTSDSKIPEGSLAVEVSDSGKIISTMQKTVDLYKKIQLEELVSYASMMEYMSGRETYSDSGLSQGENSDSLVIPEETLKKYKKEIDLINQSALEKVDLPEGTVYRYSPPKIEEVPFFAYAPGISFSLNDNLFILGSSFGATESVLKSIKNAEMKKLSSNQFYSKVSADYPKENYSAGYFNMMGVVNVLTLAKSELLKSVDEMTKAYCQDSDEDLRAYASCSQEEIQKTKTKIEEGFFAGSAIVKTLNLLGTSNSLEGELDKSSFSIYLQEIPEGEKKEAERILEGVGKSVSSAQENARKAAFKSMASSIQIKIILSCDQKQITIDDFKGEEAYFNPEEAFGSLKQNCGASGSGEFSFVLRGVDKFDGQSANCSEDGCNFN